LRANKFRRRPLAQLREEITRYRRALTRCCPQQSISAIRARRIRL
jgi:ferric-dicitrate binding protein FerR (iron transport regulator)